MTGNEYFNQLNSTGQMEGTDQFLQQEYDAKKKKSMRKVIIVAIICALVCMGVTTCSCAVLNERGDVLFGIVTYSDGPPTL